VLNEVTQLDANSYPIAYSGGQIVVDTYDFGEARQYTLWQVTYPGFLGEDGFFWYSIFTLTITGDFSLFGQEDEIKIDKHYFRFRTNKVEKRFKLEALNTYPSFSNYSSQLRRRISTYLFDAFRL